MPRDLAQDKNEETAVKTTEKVKELLTDSLRIDPTELNNEIDKVHRLLLTNKQIQTEKASSTLNVYVSLKLIAIEKNFPPRKMSYITIATRKSNFMSA